MTIPTWPADLPQRVLAEGYQESLGDGRFKTAMEVGPPKLRRRFSSAPRAVAVSFRVTADGKGRLARFWEEVGGGATPWLLPDQTTDGVALTDDDGASLADDQGRPLVATGWWLVVFGDQPPAFTPRQRGVTYVAAFPLIILP